MTILLSLTLDPDDGGAPVTLAPNGDGVWVQDLDLGFPVRRADERPRAGASGVIDRTTLHGDRAVSLQLRAKNLAVARRVIASAGPARRPMLTFEMADGLGAKRVLLTGDQAGAPLTSKSPSYLTVQVGWRCPDGVLESAEVHSRSMVPVQPPDGAPYPRIYPYTYPALGGGGGLVDAVNDGGEPSWPTFRFDGPMTDPTLYNDTTGDVFALGYAIGAGDYVEVDTRTRSVTLNGLDSAGLYQFLTFPQSSFWQLPVGTSSLRLTAAVTAAPARATITWRSGWLW